MEALNFAKGILFLINSRKNKYKEWQDLKSSNLQMPYW